MTKPKSIPFSFARSCVQPNPGWGVLCGECENIVRDTDFKYGSLSCKQPFISLEDLVRYAPKGLDISRDAILFRDFVETCAFFGPDEDSSLCGYVIRAILTLGIGEGLDMDPVAALAVVEWVNERLDLNVVMGQDMVLIFKDSTHVYVRCRGTTLSFEKEDPCGMVGWKREIDLHDPDSKEMFQRFVVDLFTEETPKTEAGRDR